METNTARHTEGSWQVGKHADGLEIYVEGDAVGMEPIWVAKEAADTVKGDPYPYVELLQKSSVRAQVGARLAPQ